MEIDNEPAVPGEPEADGGPAPDPEPEDELALARELVLRAHPATVAELVTGTTLAELLASVPAAEAAYSRVVAAASEARRASAPPIPGGGGVRSASVNVDGLSPLAKIRAGIGRS